jgi:PrcB C-terminal
MMMTLSAGIAALLMTSLPAPAGPVRSIDKGFDSQIDDARQATVRSTAEWEKLWRQHAGERAHPAVDFGKEMVAAVFLGSRPTAGFSIEIVGTREEGAALIVQYRETRPPAGGIVAQVLTSPYHIVAVPKPAAVKDVKFEKIP